MTAWIIRLHSHDERALHALVLRRRRPLDTAMRAVTHAGDAWATIALTVVLLLAPDGRVRAAGALAAWALVLSHLGVHVLKRTVSRARPSMPVGCSALVHAPDRFSFPSGHAAASLSVALGLLSIVSVPVGVAVIALALVVGISRCYLGVHYPGDVVAGWALALLGHLAGTALLG
ncbi:MAG TPA: phosphatase PAP2 family protein [Longimicrobium sp.]|jgi:undecaprenyl-diphosphatase|uniref:phosphatase PAP2 family protein n=1 Tax=Longimicrobium sp. TaxID=2029185 RepID=UPI002ED7F77C